MRTHTHHIRMEYRPNRSMHAGCSCCMQLVARASCRCIAHPLPSQGQPHNQRDVRCLPTGSSRVHSAIRLPLAPGGVQASRTHAAKFVQSCYVGIQVGSVGFPLKPPASFLLFLSPPWFFFFFHMHLQGRGGNKLAACWGTLDP